MTGLGHTAQSDSVGVTNRGRGAAGGLHMFSGRRGVDVMQGRERHHSRKGKRESRKPNVGHSSLLRNEQRAVMRK